MMVEAGANEVTEEEMLEAIMFAHEHIKELVVFQEEIIGEVGKPKMEYITFIPEADLEQQIREYATEKISHQFRLLTSRYGKKE